MDIIFLDQNKWIELARAHSGALSSGPIVELYSQLTQAVDSGEALFPLAASHVLETSKRNDPISRGSLAETQARLSQGYAYRSRAGRLKVEVCNIVHRLFSITPPELPTHWAIAHGFLQAFEPMDELVATPIEWQRLKRLNTFIDPAAQYVDFMKNQDDTRRRAAHARIAAGGTEIIANIERRRAQLTGESVDLRRRAYAVQLFIDHQEMFIRILNDLGYSFEQLEALGDQAVRSLIEDAPTLNVEAEMAARLESKTGALQANDLFDIQSFYTAIPYSSIVIAEKGSISRAQQARLDVKYSVKLSRSLSDLLDLYPRR